MTDVFGAALQASGSQVITAGQASWTQKYARAIFANDLFFGIVAALAAYFGRFGDQHQPLDQARAYTLASIAFPILFVAAVASCRAYEVRFLGSGSEEYRRVFDGAIRLGAVLGITAVALRVAPARGYLLISFPVALVGALMGRWMARRVLERLRRRGLCLHRVIAVGRERSVAELVRTVQRDQTGGFRIVGACLDTRSPRDAQQVEGVPVFGRTSDVLDAIRMTNADTVAITAFSDLDTHAVRRLGWQLEGSSVAMLLAPRVADVAGPRIHIRPVAGLPLLHVEEPEFSGGRRVLKGLMDRSVALAMLILLAPALLVVGLIVRLTSSGPALFRQERVGTRGQVFTLWKFRTMRVTAEAELQGLLADNIADGPLFKLTSDPRITKVGHYLRRYSIDELPQLIQVVTGHMSLVGPRPPLASEVVRYEDSVHRRLLVKPGLTGPWQVSGRSDLSWDDTVRLDLQYVENWSLALDISILFKTLNAVLASRGAY